MARKTWMGYSIGLMMLLGMMLLGSSALSLTPLRAPGEPPPGKVWVWAKAHWELVREAPRGVFHWENARWDHARNNWETGKWVPGPPPPEPRRPRIPARPPRGKAWVWMEAGWDLVIAPPVGPYDWKEGYWNKNRRRWISGRWVRLADRPGYEWVPPHWDRAHDLWVQGHWQRIVAPPPPPPVQPPPPGPTLPRPPRR